MDLDVTRDDISYLRRISEQALSAPLCSGRYLVLWGGLVGIAHIVQYITLSGIAGWPYSTILFCWLIVMIAAGVGMFIFSRQLKTHPQTKATEVESAVWSAVGFSVFAYAIGTMAAVYVSGAPVILFDVIIAVAFGGYGAAHLVVATIANVSWLRLPSVGAFVATAIVPFLAGEPHLYLFSAFAITMIAVVPGLVNLWHERTSLTASGGHHGGV